MTQLTSPFGGAHRDAPDERQSTPDGSKRRIALLAAVGGLAVAGLVTLNLVGGDDDVVATTAVPAAQAEAAPSPTPTPSVLAEESKALVSGRDPFRALMTPAPASPVTPDETATTVGTPDISAGTSGGSWTSTDGNRPSASTPAPGTTTPPASIPAAPPATSTPRPGATTPPAKPVTTPKPVVTLRVVDVAADNTGATVRVGSTTYEVELDEEFASGLTAVRFEAGTCGTFRHGATMFDLCEGDSRKL